MATVPIPLQLNQVESILIVTAIVRSDTNVAPGGITLPVTLTQGSPVGGLYPWTGSFTTTDPTLPPFYFATALLNGLISFNFKIFGTTPPAGMWGTLAQAQGIYSADNINLWSTSRGASAPDPTMQQNAFNQADSDLIAQITQSYYSIPGPLSSYSMTTQSQIWSSANQLGFIEAELMGAYLYQANGVQDSAKGMDGKIQGHIDHAMQALKEMLFLGRGGLTRVSGYSDAPIAVPQTVDPSGNPIDPYPPYPAGRWTGYRWLWGSTGWNQVGCWGNVA